MELVLDRHQLVLHLAADQRIQSTEGLVHEQDVGIGGECSLQPHSLLHAAAELAGVAGFVAAEADKRERSLGCGVPALDIDTLHLEPEGHVGADVLEDHPGAVTAKGLKLFGFSGSDVDVVDEHPARSWLVEPIHAADQGGLA